MIKNVIILSHDFPPATLTASQRPASWAKIFTLQGLRIIVIASQIDSEVIESVSYSREEEVEIYRLQVPSQLYESRGPRATFMEKLWHRLRGYVNPLLHANWNFGPAGTYYAHIESILQDLNIEETVLLVTGKPFFVFRVGHELHKNIGVRWIADYRDDWSTTELPIYSTYRRICNEVISKRQEIKWVSSASFFTTVSDHYVYKIHKLLSGKVKGYEVQNGFFEDQHIDHSRTKKFQNISFVYVGSLYPSQDIVTYINCLKKAVRSVETDREVDFHFLGTKVYSTLLEKIKYQLPQNLNIIIHDRLPKAEALDLQAKCHYAALVPHTDLKGVPSSKLYEFVGSRMPIVYYPNDNDIINRICTTTGLGFSAQDNTAFVALLSRLISSTDRNLVVNEQARAALSRSASSLCLLKLIKSL